MDESDQTSDALKMGTEDWLAAQMARQTAQMMLRRPDAIPETVVALGKVLFALDRHPLVTQGLTCSFGVSYDWNPSDPFGAITCECFEFTSKYIRAIRTGYERNPVNGGDSFSYLDCDPMETRDSIRRNLDDGACVIIEDCSNITIREFYPF